MVSAHFSWRQKIPTIGANETYYRGKRDLRVSLGVGALAFRSASDCPQGPRTRPLPTGASDTHADICSSMINTMRSNVVLCVVMQYHEY